MSFKRKNTKPTRVSETLHYDMPGLPIQPSIHVPPVDSSLQSVSSSNLISQPTAQTGIPFPSLHALNNGLTSDSSILNGGNEHAFGMSYQVSISLPHSLRDPPTMVTPATTGNSKWPVNSAYTVRSNGTRTDENNLQKNTIDLSFLRETDLHDNTWNISTGNLDQIVAQEDRLTSPLTNGDHNDPLFSDSSNSRPPAKKTRKIRYKYQDNTQADVKYKCDVCQYCTNRSDHYKRHLITHSEFKPLKCATCGYATGRSDHFRRHLIRHGLSKEEILAQCELNGIKTSSQNNARTAGCMKDQTDMLVPVKTANSKSTEQCGASNDPTLAKKFYCHRCGYSTDRSSHYTRHVQTHSDERPFHCDACGKKFKLDTYLKKHRCSMRTLPPSPPASEQPDHLMLDSPTSKVTKAAMNGGNMSANGSPPMCLTCGMWFQHLPDLATHICPHLLGNL